MLQSTAVIAALQEEVRSQQQNHLIKRVHLHFDNLTMAGDSL